MVWPLWKKPRSLLKKLKVDLPYDSAIPLLGTYADEVIILKDTCTSISQQHYLQWPRHVRKCIHTHTHTHTHTHHNGILLSHKKEQNNAICSNMDDLVIFILSEVSQKEKDKYHIISLI